MTLTRQYAVIAATVAAIALSTSTHAQGNQWGLQISLAKDKYILHEPIWLDIELTNMTTDTLRTDGLELPNHRRFFIELRDNSGKRMEYHGPEYLIGDGPGNLVLGAGEQDIGSFDLTDFFYSKEHNSGYSMIQRFPYIPMGTYTVQVLFDDAVSDQLTLTVVEPSGEEKEMLDLIEQASAVWNFNDPDPAAQIFLQAANKFPSSVFAERCYYIYEFFSREEREKRRGGPSGWTPIYTKMLERYPNSGNVIMWVEYITYGMDQQAREKFLSDLAAAHPNTRCAEYVRVLQAQTYQRKAGE